MFNQLSKLILLGIFVSLLITTPIHAVTNYKISNYGGGHQIWFEAEDFDERNPDTDDYFPVVDVADAFGQAINRTGGAGGMIRWTFDISAAGGTSGTWYFWARVLNPDNLSDYMLVEGDPGDAEIPTEPPFPGGDGTEPFVNDDDRILEETIDPWGWWGNDQGSIKELQNGENSMYIFHRQGADTAFWDVFVWTDDPGYRPTDEDYQNATIFLPGKANNPIPADEALHEDTWVSLNWSPAKAAVSHDVYFGENFDDVDNGIGETFRSNQPETFYVVGFPGFPYPDGLTPGTTYYWRIDEVNDTDPNSPWKGDVWSFMVPPKIAFEPEPADIADSVVLDVQLNWMPGFGSKLHTIYFGDNFDDVNTATVGFPQGNATYSPGTLELAKTYYWRIDEFDGFGTYKGQVWSFTTEGTVGSPNPEKGAVDVTQVPVLTWAPGVFGASHEVYFGSDKDAVKNADTSSPEYKGTGNLGSESYEPGELEWATTYYWRIDEANNANAESPWTGPLWSFTTVNFLIVDDMESYNDLDEGQADSNRIYLTWTDGFDNPALNGSIVGHANAPFAEQTIVHGGLQSMPMSYDNAVGKSEATLTLTSNRDWTKEGVGVLSLWFYGDASNAAEPMYVALNDNAVVTNDNPNAAQIGIWTRWTIDLTRFADQGVNLVNVNTITLGFGNRTNPVAGGTGMVFFDDIRLYQQAP
ncbi:MAG: hypothetical protein GY845_28800 [Planctomycetes bacterium]|nr:hypothetical protein [Planctomycetota bacterium]